MQALVDKAVDGLQQAFLIPRDYHIVCDVFSQQASACLPSGHDAQPEQDKKLATLITGQVALCRSTFSWLLNGFKTEKCIFELTKEDKCTPAVMSKCFPKWSRGIVEAASAASSVSSSSSSSSSSNDGVADSRSLSTLRTHVDKRSLSSHYLEKRSVLSFLPLLFIDGFLATVVLGPLLLITLVLSMVAGAIVSSNAQVEQHWNKNQNFERWMVGAPLPTCGTPILFWNSACAGLNTPQARKCARGQLYHPNACQWWWTHGSRTCGGALCQALCMDVVTDNCPAGIQPQYKLTYGQDGYGLPVPQ